MLGIGVTLSMTKGKHDIEFEPVILPWVVSMYLLMNCTLYWWTGMLSFLCQFAFNLAACYYTYGNTENVQKTAFVYFVSIMWLFANA